MLPSVVLISLAGFPGRPFFLSFLQGPWGRKSFKDFVFTIALIQGRPWDTREDFFAEPFKGVTFYVSNLRAKERAMKDVFLMDRRDPAICDDGLWPEKEGLIRARI